MVDYLHEYTSEDEPDVQVETDRYIATVAHWLHAPAFPGRQIRSDRRPDLARYLQAQQRGMIRGN
jgi:hypothetical protein